MNKDLKSQLYLAEQSTGGGILGSPRCQMGNNSNSFVLSHNRQTVYAHHMPGSGYAACPAPSPHTAYHPPGQVSSPLVTSLPFTRVLESGRVCQTIGEAACGGDPFRLEPCPAGTLSHVATCSQHCNRVGRQQCLGVWSDPGVVTVTSSNYCYSHKT